MTNLAVWIDGPGKQPRIDSAQVPQPGEGEILIKVKAVAAQPGEWKIQAGLIPIPLKYPTVIGLSLSGIVENVGLGVKKFKIGDHVAANTTSVLRHDARFGAYQRFALAPQELTAKIGQTSFEEAASLSTIYSSFSALFLHLGLERPAISGATVPKGHKILIWGVSSSFGLHSAQLARLAGYDVVAVASAKHADLASTFNIANFVNRTSESAVQDITKLGPYKAILAAADSAEDQVKIGYVLAAQGGGKFLSTMGVRPGVRLPDGVSGFFVQFLDDFLGPENREFTRWVWWLFLEASFNNGWLKSIPLEIVGGLSKVEEAWNKLKHGNVSGKRLIISPEME